MENRGNCDELALSCAVRAANETLGPEGIVPVSLVLGIITRIGTKLPNQPRARQSNADCLGRNANNFRKSKVNRSLRRAVTPAADSIYTSGDDVSFFVKIPLASQVHSRL
jgi:hypothetical protein